MENSGNGSGEGQWDQLSARNGSAGRSSTAATRLRRERDRLFQRRTGRAGVGHRGVLVADRHAAEEDEPFRRRQHLRDGLAGLLRSRSVRAFHRRCRDSLARCVRFGHNRAACPR
jgi:hypothetical protein